MVNGNSGLAAGTSFAGGDRCTGDGAALQACAEKIPTLVGVPSTVSGGRPVPSPGGVLSAGASGEIIGAVGIPGVIGGDDEICAIGGTEKAGLKALV